MSNPAYTPDRFWIDNRNPNYTRADLDRTRQEGWIEGKEYCKQEILKILKEDWTGCDLSINSCDEYYIERIEKEI